MILSPEDTNRLHEYQAALVATNAVEQAVDMQVGRVTLPLKTQVKEAYGAVIKTVFTAKGALEALGSVIPGLLGAKFREEFVDQFKAALKEIQESADATAKALEHAGNQPLIPPELKPEKGGKSPVEKTTEDYRGLSEVLDQVTSKMAKATSPEADVAAEMNRMADSVQHAVEKLKELNQAGRIDPAVFDREVAAAGAALRILPALQDQLYAALDQKRSAEIARAMAALDKAQTDEFIRGLAARQKEDDALDAQLKSFHTATLAEQLREWDAEMEAMKARYAAEGNLTAANEAKIAAIRQAGIDKIQHASDSAFDSEMARLDEQRERIEGVYQTSEEKIEGQYAADVAKFDAAEEKKTLATARSDAERAAIAAGFEAVRAALLTKEQTELQALHNSQGWQAVFGNEFAQTIKRNEDLSREWASSVDQSAMLVRVSLESLKETARNSFAQIEKGMASNIVHAIMYKQSIGEAMEAAAKAVVQSIAEQAAVQAIEAAAWGFLDLAMGDFADAAAAFESAALFGSVGAAAAIAGSAMGGGAQGGGGGASASGAGARASSSSASAAGYGAGGGGGQQNPNTVVNVWGHVIGVSGIQELTAAINDAVLNRDVSLTATNTKTGVQVTR
jgi:hypothetical protein